MKDPKKQYKEILVAYNRKKLIHRIKQIPTVARYHFLRTLCRCGIHQYDQTPIIADLDTYWVQGGKECLICRSRRISFNQASSLISRAYDRGKSNAKNDALAYGGAIKPIVDLYGKKYVYDLIDKL